MCEWMRSVSGTREFSSLVYAISLLYGKHGRIYTTSNSFCVIWDSIGLLDRIIFKVDIQIFFIYVTLEKDSVRNSPHCSDDTESSYNFIPPIYTNSCRQHCQLSQLQSARYQKIISQCKKLFHQFAARSAYYHPQNEKCRWHFVHPESSHFVQLQEWTFVELSRRAWSSLRNTRYPIFSWAQLL